MALSKADKEFASNAFDQVLASGKSVTAVNVAAVIAHLKSSDETAFARFSKLFREHGEDLRAFQAQWRQEHSTDTPRSEALGVLAALDGAKATLSGATPIKGHDKPDAVPEPAPAAPKPPRTAAATAARLAKQKAKSAGEAAPSAPAEAAPAKSPAPAAPPRRQRKGAQAGGEAKPSDQSPPASSAPVEPPPPAPVVEEPKPQAPAPVPPPIQSDETAELRRRLEAAELELRILKEERDWLREAVMRFAAR